MTVVSVLTALNHLVFQGEPPEGDEISIPEKNDNYEDSYEHTSPRSDQCPFDSSPANPLLCSEPVSKSDITHGRSSYRKELLREIKYIEEQFMKIPAVFRDNPKYTFLAQFKKHLNRIKAEIENGKMNSANDLMQLNYMKESLWGFVVKLESAVMLNINNFNPNTFKMLFLSLPKSKRDDYGKALFLFNTGEVKMSMFSLERAVRILDIAINMEIAFEALNKLNGKKVLVLGSDNERYRIIAKISEPVKSVNEEDQKVIDPEEYEAQIKARRAEQRETDKLNRYAKIADEIELLLVILGDVKLAGMDLKYIVKLIEEQRYFRLKRISEWSKELEMEITVDELKNGKPDLVDRLSVAAAKARAKVIDKLIGIVSRASIDWNLELSRRISEKADKYRAEKIYEGDSPALIDYRIQTYLSPQWTNEMIGNIETEGRDLFRKAEEYWIEKRPEGAGFLSDIPKRLNRVTNHEDWMEIMKELSLITQSKYADYNTIAETIRAVWLVGGGNEDDRGYIGWLRKVVKSSMPSGDSKMYPHASATFDVLFNKTGNSGYIFRRNEMKIPISPDRLSAFNEKHVKNVNVIFKLISLDERMNDIAMFVMGALSASVGIAFASRLVVAATARQTAWGISAGELAAMNGFRYKVASKFVSLGNFSLETLGFTVGADAVMLPITGIPTLGEFWSSLKHSFMIFAGIHGLGHVLRFAFGLRPFVRVAADDGAGFFRRIRGQKISAETVLQREVASRRFKNMWGIDITKDLYSQARFILNDTFKGANLRAIQSLIGYSGSARALTHEAIHFAMLLIYLKHADIAISDVGLADPMVRPKDDGFLPNMNEIASLFIIIVGSRATSASTKKINDAASNRFYRKGGLVYELEKFALLDKKGQQAYYYELSRSIEMSTFLKQKEKEDYLAVLNALAKHLGLNVGFDISNAPNPKRSSASEADREAEVMRYSKFTRLRNVYRKIESGEKTLAEATSLYKGLHEGNEIRAEVEAAFKIIREAGNEGQRDLLVRILSGATSKNLQTKQEVIVIDQKPARKSRKPLRRRSRGRVKVRGNR